MSVLQPGQFSGMTYSPGLQGPDTRVTQTTGRNSNQERWTLKNGHCVECGSRITNNTHVGGNHADRMQDNAWRAERDLEQLGPTQHPERRIEDSQSVPALKRRVWQDIRSGKDLHEHPTWLLKHYYQNGTHTGVAVPQHETVLHAEITRRGEDPGVPGSRRQA